MLVSECFFGGTSDGITVLKGDLLPLLEEGDDVLADKGIFYENKLNSFQLIHE